MMEVTFSTSIFTELDRCSGSDELLDFTMPTDLNEPISVYSSENEINEIDN